MGTYHAQNIGKGRTGGDNREEIERYLKGFDSPSFNKGRPGGVVKQQARKGPLGGKRRGRRGGN